MLEDELCALLYQDRNEVRAKLLFIGYGFIQALAEHR
jgi:hypothetical protein